jgi:hypothetical protein
MCGVFVFIWYRKLVLSAMDEEFASVEKGDESEVDPFLSKADMSKATDLAKTTKKNS